MLRGGGGGKERGASIEVTLGAQGPARARGWRPEHPPLPFSSLGRACDLAPHRQDSPHLPVWDRVPRVPLLLRCPVQGCSGLRRGGAGRHVLQAACVLALLTGVQRPLLSTRMEPPLARCLLRPRWSFLPSGCPRPPPRRVLVPGCTARL